MMLNMEEEKKTDIDSPKTKKKEKNSSGGPIMIYCTTSLTLSCMFFSLSLFSVIYKSFE